MEETNKQSREKIVTALFAGGRGYSDATVILHGAIARKVGLAGTDHKYLSILLQEKKMTAGELAELTHLTTGAVTGLIDRLEKKGLVRRERDKSDRRKVYIEVDQKKAEEIFTPIFVRFHEKLSAIYGRYSTEELVVILDFMKHTEKTVREFSDSLKK